MFDPTHLIFLHGLEGTSQGVKATLLRSLFPEMSTPDFPGPLDERMTKLYRICGMEVNWTIIGSSYGGLMGALFTCHHPNQVRKLVLLAPALVLPEFADQPPAPVEVPTIVYHSRIDEIVPYEPTRKLAEQVFKNLSYHAVDDDDHGLYKLVYRIDWPTILA